ncbi:DUF4391 domain-containing protein [Pasteurellaceae bacterium HPA106]|uniref:DUF4391 domain-containing protein n=1 Tax=Spirabiliibacterium pneumoniae TaxID=221400 RepID=UPI001AACCA0A|nr:DUF4391 domain-containing protein [Spirabiliibacterium pneumoniae]MBE2896637.1 DUF4391 domain-containing protein [Spirabiliibacterium pneumoniae]
MIKLPKSTEFEKRKRIPKQQFYEKIDIPSAVKKAFVAQIKAIYWRNKIDASKANLAPSDEVIEIEVFEILLNQPSIDEALLKQIDKQIPYHIIFLLEYQGKYQAWIGYKEAAAAGNHAFKVNRYYHTQWLAEEQLSLRLEGLDIKSAYENFIRQIAGERLSGKQPSGSLKAAVECDEQRQKLQKRIAALQRKIAKEKQLNKQMLLNTELKKLKQELENL